MRPIFFGITASVLVVSACTAMVNGELDDKPPRAARDASAEDASSAPTNAGDGAAANAPADAGNPSSSDATVSASSDGGSPASDDASSGNPSGTPGAAPVELCVGVTHACGLMPSGTVTCWGDSDNDDGQTTLQTANPGVRFVDVSCGDYHTCGVTSQGSVLCVGRNRDGQREAPSAADHHDYVQVAAGDVQTCARKHNGTLDCWGGSGAITWTQPPGDAFSTISAGTGFACGVRSLDGSILCWGDNTHSQTRAPTDFRNVHMLDVGDGEGCAVDDSGAASCWGDDGASIVPVLPSVASISVGGDYGHARGCALLSNASATCWADGQISMMPGPYRAVVVGSEATCFLPVTGNITCKSGDGNPSLPDPIVSKAPQPYPPPGEVLP